jgi:hypothetical protein
MDVVWVFLISLIAFGFITFLLVWSVKTFHRQRAEMEKLPRQLYQALRPNRLVVLDPLLSSLIVLLVVIGDDAFGVGWVPWAILVGCFGLVVIHGWFLCRSLKIGRGNRINLSHESILAVRREGVSHGLAAVIYATFGFVFGPLDIL